MPATHMSSMIFSPSFQALITWKNWPPGRLNQRMSFTPVLRGITATQASWVTSLIQCRPPAFRRSRSTMVGKIGKTA